MLTCRVQEYVDAAMECEKIHCDSVAENNF